MRTNAHGVLFMDAGHGVWIPKIVVTQDVERRLSANDGFKVVSFKYKITV